MIVLRGKYNQANIMIDEIDDTTKEQIQEMLNHPAFAGSYIVIMPDCHAGNGAVIGFTMKMNDYIIPNIVGVDIGCGMLAGQFDHRDINLEKFDTFVKENVPAGFNIHVKSKIEKDSEFVTSVKYWAAITDQETDKIFKSIGTLGGGNHFIEAGLDSQDKLWITIHTGSRNFGLRIAQHFQRKAKLNLEKYFIYDKYKNMEFLLADSAEGKLYLSALKFSQEYALRNRMRILHIISKFFENQNISYKPRSVISSVHNFIDKDKIIRKGATPANKNQMVLLPFNMKDGIAICKGLGSSKYNFSAPHGAGRILSRKKAREELSLDSFVNEMRKAGIYTTSASIATIDEAPAAYKDKEIILRNIAETVEVIDMIRPIYNFKAQEAKS